MALLDELHKHLVRNYPFTVVPPTLRNTFVGSTITLDMPAVRFRSAGTQETNKLVELQVEKQFDFNLSKYKGPGATSAEDFTQLITCQMSAFPSIPSRFASNSFIGIEIGSAAQTVLASPTPSGVVRVCQRLDDETLWFLEVGFGDNLTANSKIDFTVPTVNSPPAFGSGHHVGILMDPHTQKIHAIVDGQVRATFDGQGGLLWPTLYASTDNQCVGLIAHSGSMSAAAVLEAMWTGMTCLSLDTHQIGSGLI